MSKSKILFAISMLAVLVSGCKQNNESSSDLSSDYSSESIVSDESSDSESIPEVVPPENIEQCLNSIQYYNAYFISPYDGSKSYVEFNGENYFSYFPARCGYAVIDEDPDYAHFFKIDFKVGSIYYVDMYGRIWPAEDYEKNCATIKKFWTLINDHKKDFKQNLNNKFIFTYHGWNLSKDAKEYFQLSEFSFCDYFQLEFDENYQFKSFFAGETIDSPAGLAVTYTEKLYFESCTWDELDFVKSWKENGSPITNRIADYKATYVKNDEVCALYDEGEVTGYVGAIDYDGSFYISNDDVYNGPVGIKVCPLDHQYVPNINDIVKVKGKIAIDNNERFKESPYLYEASVSKVEESEYGYYFSEESVADQYYPGCHAINYFIKSPFFNGSIYTGYGYAGHIPESANPNGDTIVKIYCSAYKYTADDSIFNMNLIFPKEYGVDNINAVLDELRLLGDYEINKNCSLVEFRNVVVSYPFDRPLSVNLLVMKNSQVSHKFSFLEWVENDFGISDFPDTPIALNRSTYFHFGPQSKYYLEDMYSSVREFDENVSGLYFYGTSIPRTSYENFVTALKNIGFVEYDRMQLVLTVYQYHIYFSRGDTIVDMIVEDYGTSSVSVALFLYKGDEFIRYRSIEEKIQDRCSAFFGEDDFIKLPGTYDMDYHYYELLSYAGNSFSENNPLVCVTIDILQDRYDELRQLYREAGWKQYRDENGKAFSYSTRGVNRVIYYRDNSDGTKTFIDFGSYPTVDYTFLRHEVFDPRIEILIYSGYEPIVTQYTRDLSDFVYNGCSYCPENAFDWIIPEGYKAEVYLDNQKFAVNYFDYGYGLIGNAFIYPTAGQSLDEIYEYVISTFRNNGFTHYATGKRSVTYRKDGTAQDQVYYSAVFCIMKEESHGYVRILNSWGGADY